MNEISQEFADHLAGTVTTVCHCWRLRREDGTVLGFTDHDRPLFVDGEADCPRLKPAGRSVSLPTRWMSPAH